MSAEDSAAAVARAFREERAAVLATVFARHGVYTSAETFVDGFAAALWVAVAFSCVRAIAALLTGARAGAGHGVAPEAALAA